MCRPFPMYYLLHTESDATSSETSCPPHPTRRQRPTNPLALRAHSITLASPHIRAIHAGYSGGLIGHPDTSTGAPVAASKLRANAPQLGPKKRATTETQEPKYSRVTIQFRTFFVKKVKPAIWIASFKISATL